MEQLKLQFFPTYIDFEINTKGTTEIRLFGRTLDDKTICVIDEFEPYFYIIPSASNLDLLQKELESIFTEYKGFIYKITKTELKEINYLRNKIKVIKTYTNNPSALTYLIDQINNLEISDLKETDIPLTRRYLIDKKITPLILTNITGTPVKRNIETDLIIKADTITKDTETYLLPKILAFDIEVYSETKSPNSNEDPIIMVSFYSENFQKVITWKKFPTDKDYIHFVNTESQLIQEFKTTIKNFKPDYLVGYFSDGFDFPYLSDRAKQNNIRLNLGLDNSNVKFTRRNSIKANITGINHIDIFRFIRTIMQGSLQLDSYSLDNVAKEVLDKRKNQEVSIEFLYKAWDENKDLEKFSKYNLEDSKLAYELAFKILPNITELVKLTNVPIYDVSRMSYGQLVEAYLIKTASELNELIPDKPKYDLTSERRMHTYQGAFVLQPIPGLYENLAVLDFKSLYPTIIVAHNIDPATLTSDKKNSYKSPGIMDESGKEVHYYFNYKEEGFIPKAIKEILIRRNRVKEIIAKEKKCDPILEARNYALKTVANSSYGYLGFFGARWYSRESAASITAFARDYILKTIDKAKTNGFEVLYCDTDSIFLNLKNKTKKDALNFLNEVNRELPSLMELELEAFYPRGIFVMKKTGLTGAKKKYALIDEKNEIKLRGFEAVRRDWSYLAKNTQKEVLRIILENNSVKEALDYVRLVVNKIRDKQLPKEDMIIRTQLKKGLTNYELEGPHVFVARKLSEKGVKITPGSVIKYIVTQGSGKIRDRAKSPEECSEKDYDPEYYINNQIIPSVRMIFEALGITKENLLENTEQSKLGDF